MYSLSEQSKKNRKGINDRLIQISDLAIQITKIDFGIPKDGGVHTPKRQNELFKARKSKADGYEKLSNHQSGEAIDFYAYIDGKASWRHDHLAMVASAFLQAASMLGYKLEWGGLWSSSQKINGIPYGWDMAHVELG